MFTRYDKAAAAALVNGGVAMAISFGWLTTEQGAGVAGFLNPLLVFFVPNVE